MKRHYGILWLLAVVCWLPAGDALARNYYVEVIVFAPPEAEAEADSGELWNFSAHTLQPAFEKMAELAEQAGTPALGRTRILATVRANLARDGYRILREASWSQPGRTFHRAPVISLADGRSALASGYVRIYKTSLIFANIDLQFSPPTAAGEATPHYFLTEKRRLKFKEIHYFDHPKFGVILGVWPAAAE